MECLWAKFNPGVTRNVNLDEIKEELGNVAMAYGEPVLIGTGLYPDAREVLLSKMIELNKKGTATTLRACKNSSNLKSKIEIEKRNKK